MTAATATINNDWIQDEDGFRLSASAFLAWHETDGPETGYTVGVEADLATDELVASTLADVERVFGPDFSCEEAYTDGGYRLFEFLPWAPTDADELLPVAIPLG